jgi:hypothetical protein
MAAYVFPTSPVDKQRYPVNPGVAGTSQYEWDNTNQVWNVVPPFVRTNNQAAYNSYTWPTSKSTIDGYQLTDVNATGALTWEIPGGPFFYLDDISSQFTGNVGAVSFNLKRSGLPFIPDPVTNLIVVLGGIVQTYGTSYTIFSDVITFSFPPAAGASFCAISNRECADIP